MFLIKLFDGLKVFISKSPFVVKTQSQSSSQISADKIDYNFNYFLSSDSFAMAENKPEDVSSTLSPTLEPKRKVSILADAPAVQGYDNPAFDGPLREVVVRA